MTKVDVDQLMSAIKLCDVQGIPISTDYLFRSVGQLVQERDGAVAIERSRCVAIIEEARSGDGDTDLRAIRSRIQSGYEPKEEA